MKAQILPLTINLHSTIPCNFHCGFCYAGFPSVNRKSIPQAELHEILRQIASVPMPAGRNARKVTFAGGEPLLSPTLVDDVTYAKQLGLVTAIVTNGSLLSSRDLKNLAPNLDWLTISIDSLVPETNMRIGRAFRGKTLSAADLLWRFEQARALGVRTKINTVVCRHNHKEVFTAFIRDAKPLRWKVLQVTLIAGENDSCFGDWALSDGDFHAFIARHVHLKAEGITLVPETQEDLYGTYAMVGPNGCFYDNSKGSYIYSRPITEVGIERAFEEIRFSEERFERRQGDYNFNTGLNRSISRQ
jgi:radical S-adenosyl methionine domain-containing protein 2